MDVGEAVTTFKWSPATILAASWSGPQPRPGLVYRGVAITPNRSKRQRRATDSWTLYHFNTGLSIGDIRTDEVEAFHVATLIAECGDWEFEGPQGWRNADPELAEKVREIASAFPFIYIGGGYSENADRAAREVMAARR